MMISNRSSGNGIADRRFTYALAYKAAGDHSAAVDLATQALELAPTWAAGWFALGDLHESAGHQAAAIAAYRKAVALDASDGAGARARLARLGSEDKRNALSPHHVAALFDDYAPRFEKALIEDLGYRGPELLRQALDEVAPRRRFSWALDLGCGTGLAGEAFRDVCDHLHGVDLSGKMLAGAASKRIYSGLTQGDIARFVDEQRSNIFDLVLAADVLVYLGDLGSLFQAVSRILTSGGLFLFTVQRFEEMPPHPDASHRPSPSEGRVCETLRIFHPPLDGEGRLEEPGRYDEAERFRFGEDLRYAHSDAGLRAWAKQTGLAIRHLEAASTRMDAGKPVPGWIALLEKPAVSL